MENASKALLIAGAILIAILLIAIGMYIYNGSKGTFDSAVGKMSQQEKDIYNADFTPYIGDNIRGSQIRAMIDRVISSNQSNTNQPGKFIGINVNNLTNYTESAQLAAACNLCDIYSGTANAANDENNVQSATTLMNNLKSRINTSKNYQVQDTRNEGAITLLTITQTN